jgi:hypothetical protein
MTTTIVRRLCDGEELVVTDREESSPLLEGDPREPSFRRRSEAMSDDARVRPGHDPRRSPPQDAR